MDSTHVQPTGASRNLAPLLLVGSPERKRVIMAITDALLPLVNVKPEDARGAVRVAAGHLHALAPEVRAEARPHALARLEAIDLDDDERADLVTLLDTPPEPDPLHDPLPDGVDPASELATAHRIVRGHGANLRYCDALGGWMAWDVRRWARDDDAPYRCAMETVGRMLVCAAEVMAQAVGKNERAEADALLRAARRAQSEPAIRHALELARHLLAVGVEVWDRDPMRFNVVNGTIHLQTGELRPHRRDDYITRLSPVDYDPNADAPTWLRVTSRALPDPDLLDHAQRAIGYSISGLTGEQVMFVAHGSGANAKSTIIEALRFVMGDYATHAATDTLMQSRGPRGPENDVARLRGSYFVTLTESAEGRRLDEERVKRLTGGDTITARYLYAEPFEFTPVCKLWLITNDLPRVTGGEAIWRRLRLIPFGVVIPEGERDPNLPEKLRAEAPGILAWAVRGCLAWQIQGLAPPDAVRNAGSAWRDDEDPLADWIADRCVEAPGTLTTLAALYESYTAHARAANAEPISRRVFGDRLAVRGYARAKSGKRGHRGIALSGESRQTEAMLS